MAGLLEEGFAIPFVLDRHLWQKQPAPAMLADEKPVASNYDFFRSDGLGAGQNAELNLQFPRFGLGDGRKAAVVKGRGTGSFRDGPVQGARWHHISDAAAQLPVPVQRCESAARLGQMRTRRLDRQGSAFDRGQNGLVRQAKQ